MNTKPIDQAFQIYEKWAQAKNKKYDDILVKENLSGYLKSGYSPQQAVAAALVVKSPHVGEIITVYRAQ